MNLYLEIAKQFRGETCEISEISEISPPIEPAKTLISLISLISQPEDPPPAACPICGQAAGELYRGLCFRCSTERQELDDADRWHRSAARGETRAQKCRREATEYCGARDEWRLKLRRGSP